MNHAFTPAGERAMFTPERMTKLDLVRGDLLFAGLNCFEPGQSQPVHVHANADKFYLVLSGKGEDDRRLDDPGRRAGDAWVGAPAGAPHGVDEALERTVMLVAMAPPPG